MTTQTLAAMPASWRHTLIDLERALAPIVRRPRRFDQATRRWAAVEPALTGLDASTTFAAPGALSEPQARALIRVCRTGDPDAELAGWALIWQFAPGLINIARREARAGGSEGQRAAACTAMAELWRQIQRIDLDTNRASIFYALLATARRAAIPSVHGITPADRLVWSLVDPAGFLYCDEGVNGPDPDASNDPVPRRSGAVRVLYQFRDPVAAGVDQRLDQAEWDATVAVLANQLADRLTDDLVADLGWSQGHAHFERRRARLRAYLGARIASADLGDCPTAAEIATAIDAPFLSVRDLHKHVNRAFRHSAGHYRRTVLASIGDTVNTAA